MKPIERLVRSDVWDARTRAAFFAHLEKPMKDDARLGYCDRKASFLARNPHKVAAGLALLEWALATFTRAGRESRAYACATRSELLEMLGKKREARAAYRAAKRLNPHFA